MQFFNDLWNLTGFHFINGWSILMVFIGMVLVWLAVAKGFEPLLLVPIGFGVIIGNMPFDPVDSLSVYLDRANGTMAEPNTFSFLYFLVEKEILPPLIFLGIGALTDFSYMISSPRLILLGAAAQAGVFCTFIGAILLSFWLPVDPISVKAAAAIAIIGGADGPTSIYLANRMAPEMLGPIAIAAYSYMSLVPVIQPPVMRFLTTREERLIRMAPPRLVSHRAKVMFPILGFFICTLLIPSSMVLMGMLFLGNLIRESGVTDRLAKTIGGPFIDSCTIILGLCVGLGTTADRFLQPQVLLIFALGAFAFAVSTAGGVLMAKFMNLFSTNKINPLVGSAGVSAVPMAARVSQVEAQKEDPNNYLIMHAMAPNVAGVIGTAVAAGVFLAILGK